jgi:proline iminopeptidase
MHASVNGARIYFDIDGEGSAPSGSTMTEKPTLFLLHGGPGADHSYFKPWVHSLTEVAQIIYVDHRGNGRSELTGPETYNLVQMADDLEALRQLLGLGRVQVLGHSFGGMVALTYALRYPDGLESLLLCTTTASREFRDDAWEVAERVATPEQLAVLATLFDGKITSDEEHDEWWRVCLPLYFHEPDETICAELLGREHAQLGVVNYMMAHEIPNYNVVGRLGEITVPTLVMSGRHDWVTPPSQGQVMADGIPGATFKVFESSGHFPFIEEQEAFLDLVSRFVAAQRVAPVEMQDATS